MPNWLSWRWFSTEQWQLYSWESDFWLYGILLVPIIALIRWLIYRNNRPSLALHLPSEEDSGGYWKYWRLLSPLFFSLGFSLVWVALARPQSVIESKEEVTVGVNIILALDLSESMLNEDVKPSRFEAAKEVAKEFIEKRSSDKIGLVVFAGEAYTLCPLTSDHDLLKTYIDDISPDLIKISGTAIGNALAVSITRLKDIPGESKVIVLVSDGDNKGGKLEPMTAVELAKTFGIRIYTVALGNDFIEFDTHTLNNIAKEGDGLYFKASDSTSLSMSFDQISALETVRFNNRVVKEVRDYFTIYLNWALLFLLLGFILKSSFLGNILED